MPDQLEFFTVDAFTKEPFTGNPAAVIILPQQSDDTSFKVGEDLCQSIAAEFNLSETAFATPLGGGDESEKQYEIKWFTPTSEIPLCGHATLASSYVLFTHHHPQATSIRFETRTRGHLIARKNSEDSSISLDFPSSSLVTLSEGHKRRKKILEKVRKVVKEEQIKRIDWSDEISGVTIELSEDIDLPSLDVDPSLLSGIGDIIILTQPAPPSSAFDIYSRVFGPDVGVLEDPVTGAAHTALGPFWLSSPSLSRLHRSSSIKEASTLRAKQVSKRGGEMIVKFDQEKKRVELRGWARQMMKGQISL